MNGKAACLLCNRYLVETTAPGFYLHEVAEDCLVRVADQFGVSLDDDYEVRDDEIFARAASGYVDLDDGAIELTQFFATDQAISQIFAEKNVPRLGGISSGSGWSNVSLFQKCPYAWKRRYLDRVEQPNILGIVGEPLALAIGSLTHVYLAIHYYRMITPGYPLTVEDVNQRMRELGCNPAVFSEAWRLFTGYRLYYKNETLQPLAVEHDLKDPRTGHSCRYDLIAFIPDESPGILPGTYIVESKCLTGDSLVHDYNTSRLVRIDELFRRGIAPKVLSYDLATGKLVRAQALVPIANTVRPIYDVVSESGRRVRASDNHPILTSRGWVCAGDLKPGDWIAVAKNTGGLQQASRFTDAEVRFLGFMLSEGYLTGLAFSQLAGPVFDAFIETLYAMGFSEDGSTPHTFRREQKSYALKDGTISTIQTIRLPTSKGSPARELLGDLGLFGLRSAQKCTPEEFNELSDHQVGIFLGALWDGDGCQCADEARMDVTIKHGSRSRALCEASRDLLLRLGIHATVRASWTVFNGVRYDVYNTTVVGRPSKRAFLDRVIDGTIRSVRLISTAVALRERLIDGDDTLVPVACIVDELAEQRLKIPWVYNGTRQLSSTVLNKFKSQPSSALERRTLSKWAEDLPLLKKHAETEIWWEQVESVVISGEERTYDLTVPGQQNFVVNGVITHNTAARFDSSSLEGWSNDGEVLGQVDLWDRLHLDRRYGKLRGVIINLLGKQKVAEYHRTIVSPSSWQIEQHRLDLRRWNGLIQLAKSSDSFPRARNSCIGRFGKCNHWDHCATGE